MSLVRRETGLFFLSGGAPLESKDCLVRKEQYNIRRHWFAVVQKGQSAKLRDRT